MIRRIQALQYRCLRYVDQNVGDFHVLVGPNASGKSSFLEVIGFLGSLVGEGLESAVFNDYPDFRDLVWQRQGSRFELAIELAIPESRRKLLPRPEYSIVRYEVAIGEHGDAGEVGILAEKVLLRGSTQDDGVSRQRTLFPMETDAPETILARQSRSMKTVVNKVPDGNDNFYDETGKGWDHAFKLGPRKSALASLPEDETKFPVAAWLKKVLVEGVQELFLQSWMMRRASPPGQPRGFQPTGANLPWVLERLRAQDPVRFSEWIAHVRTALPDVVDIKIIERPEDRHRYLVVCYDNNVEVPSWSASDGTLRLLALTLIAYLPEIDGVFLIEEPENGIHPRAVETVYQSLSSVYGAQVLISTHSPVILSVADPKQVLCFKKTQTGATDIVRGDDHPALRDWRGETNLGVLFAGGVLG